MNAWEQIDHLLGGANELDAQLLKLGIFEDMTPLRDEAGVIHALAATSWITLRCARGHNIAAVRLLLGTDGRTLDLDVEERFRQRVVSVVGANPFLSTTYNRVEMQCAQRQHKYRSVWTRNQLLPKVAAAVQAGGGDVLLA